MQGMERNDSELLAALRCTDFSSALASAAPVPGGGGAAALAGALGVALCSMAGNLTLGRKKYANVEADVRAMLEKAETLRLRFLALVDEDAEAFAPLQRAYAIPRDAPDRAAVMARVSLDACQAPLSMLRCCVEALALLSEMLEKGSAMLVSDVGCGAALCRASAVSAGMNVLVNLKPLDPDKAAAIERETDALMEHCRKAADAIIAEVCGRLSLS